MKCPICGATCVCKNATTICCSCHKHGSKKVLDSGITATELESYIRGTTRDRRTTSLSPAEVAELSQLKLF